MTWFSPFTIFGDYTLLAISNAFLVLLLFFSWQFLFAVQAEFEKLKRQTSNLQNLVKKTTTLVDSIDSAHRVIETLNSADFRRTIDDLRKLQIIYVSHQDESTTNTGDCFTDTLSRFVESSDPEMRTDLGSGSDYETCSINESNLGSNVKSKAFSRFVERTEIASVSECETNSMNETNLEASKSINPQTLPDLPESLNENRAPSVILSAELHDDDRGEDMPEQSDHSADNSADHSSPPLGLDDGYAVDSVTGDDFELPVFSLGFAKLVEEMQLEGFVNEAQSEFLEDIFHSNSRGIFLRNFLQEYNRSPEDLHRLKMDLRTFASNPEDFSAEPNVNAEDQYSVCASVGSVTTLNSTTNEKRVFKEPD